MPAPLPPPPPPPVFPSRTAAAAAAAAITSQSAAGAEPEGADDFFFFFPSCEDFFSFPPSCEGAGALAAAAGVEEVEEEAYTSIPSDSCTPVLVADFALANFLAAREAAFAVPVAPGPAANPQKSML